MNEKRALASRRALPKLFYVWRKKQQAPFALNSKFDRNFKIVLDSRLGFYDGKLSGSFFPILLS
jgi:hypothetical protein